MSTIKVMLEVECVGGSSFADIKELVKAAKRWKCLVRTKIAGRAVIAEPGDDANYLYKGFGLDGGPAVPAWRVITREAVAAVRK